MCILFEGAVYSEGANYSRKYGIHILAASRLYSYCGGLPVALRPTKPSVSKNGLGRPQNDLGGFRDQAYHFQHQKLPLYAQSREPFHTGLCWPFRTNMQTASGGLKMTSEAAKTRPIIFNIKSYPCMPEAGSHSI